MSDKIEVDIKCAHCGKQLQSDEQPCSYCGLTGRIIDVCTSEAREMNESVRGKMKNTEAKVKKHILQEFVKEIPTIGTVKRRLSG